MKLLEGGLNERNGFLRHFEELRGIRWSRNRQLDLFISHWDFGFDPSLKEKVCVHLQPRINKFRDVWANLSDEL